VKHQNIPKSIFFPFIKKSVHYKTISTTYVVELKILHYFVHALQGNIAMNIIQ